MLNDKVAVVTGGSRGIGFATVKKFLENGAKVVLFALKTIDPNYEVSGFYPNLSNLEEVTKAFQMISEKYGSIDILVNNAGMSDDTSIYNYTEEQFEKVMNLNVKAVFNCSRAVVPIMKENGGGVILNTSSMVSIYGQSTGCAYPTSKFAVNGITKSLARELGRDHIRVNAVAPGVIYTDMVKNLPEKYIGPLLQSIPLGRMGEAEDVANAFLFLASDMASYITGAILSVDGAARS